MEQAPWAFRELDIITDTSVSESSTPTRGPIIWLRLEGLTVFICALWIYGRGGYSWILFGILFFLPDVSFVAYLRGPRVGAICYNVVHSYVIPLALLAIHVAAGRPLALPVIWIAHIGFDRMLGYGLKYSSGFGETHLGRIGRRRPD